MDVSHAVPPCLPCLSIIYPVYIDGKATLLMITESPGCIRATPRRSSTSSVSNRFQLEASLRRFSLSYFPCLLFSSTCYLYSACILVLFFRSVKIFFFIYFLFISSTALLILLAASTWTRIVRIDLLLFDDGAGLLLLQIQLLLAFLA